MKPNTKLNSLLSWTHGYLHFFYAGVDVEDSVVAGTNDRFVLKDDDLKWTNEKQVWKA